MHLIAVANRYIAFTRNRLAIQFMRIQNLTLSAIVFALIAQALLAWHLYVTTHKSYDAGDAVLIFIAIPAISLFLSAYLFLRSSPLWQASGKSKRWQLSGTPTPPPKAAWGLFGAGVLLGLLGFWGALAGGPHVAPFLIVWPQLLQVLLFVIARLTVRNWQREVVARECPK
jgi:hypothetical protein